MDKVLFGRHVDAPLDEHGERQAESVADYLRTQLDRPLIEASPRRRTRQTAAAIAARFDCEVRSRAELDEIDFGRWSGQPFAELENDPEWRRWNTERGKASTPTGETIVDVQERASTLLASLAREHPDRTIVVVSHCEIIRSLVLFCLGASPNRYDALAIDPASITRLSIEADRRRIDSVNERPAL